MNGVNLAAGPPGQWQEARNNDGRVYYYNTATKVTQWTKPLELMSPAERALSNQPWKEYTAEGGKKYWYNTETKMSSWEMPEAYKNALAQSLPAVRPPAPIQQFVAGGTSSFSSYSQPRDKDNYGERVGPDRQIGYGQTNGSSVSAFGTQQTDPDYSTFEEGEAAFIKLLRRSNVQPDWTWEQTMRATIKDPQYRALKDPKDRKAAFEKYAVEVRMQEKDRAKERLAKLRADFGTMLRSHPEIKHYTRWKTARPIIEGETIFRSTNDDNERRQLFEEYIIELKKSTVEREAVTRKSAMDELVGILKALNLEPYTRWSEAHGIIQSNERFQGDDKFKSLSKSDILTAFENHIKSLERTFNDERQHEKNSKARKERQNRDRFIALLAELKAAGKIKAGTKWMQILSEIDQDPRYTALLGQSGSTPLDLFWDMVEEEERALRLIRNEVYDVLEDKRYEITPKTTLQDFLGLMSTDRRTATTPPETLTLIFNRLLEKVLRRTEDDKHASERQQRRLVDALRSKIKHLDNPPVLATSTWESVRPLIAHFEEFKALDSDDLRRQAFDKVVRRLKEKEEDAEKEREKERSSKRDRERDRDRDRDARNGTSSHHRPTSSRRVTGRPSRTPEPDAYEADRRKAQADRERQYGKSRTTGLSPQPRDHPDRDRHERLSSRHAGPRLSHYDRERREREEERERLYRTRGDPRGSRDELDYGEGRGSEGGRGGSGRRRRGPDSDGESVGRDSKRSRRERTPRERTPPVRRKSRTPVVSAPVKEDPAVHSGSEEGEMVEEE
ncbi:MAG: formin binding [Lasallia pustulata]|uniref:Formin binding n=1 Tax=Lasallia pustulata TaxID=136370 RepID=A0A5M8PNB0_9LECA|nr:MAG: formin binding [Lasallia pustulata]